MIKLNYTKEAVLTIFIENGGKLDPSTGDIQKLDKNLFDANEDLLVEQMTDAGLDSTNLALKSQILVYSQSTPGGSVAAQIQGACIFFKNTELI